MRTTFTVHENAPGTWVVGRDPNTQGFGTPGSFGVYLYESGSWRCEACGESTIPAPGSMPCAHVMAVHDSNPTLCNAVELGYDPCPEVGCGMYFIDGTFAATNRSAATALCPHHVDSLKKHAKV